MQGRVARADRAYPGNASSLSLGSWTLASPASRDMEQFTNVLAERVSYQFGTRRRLVVLAHQARPLGQARPVAIVRGGIDDPVRIIIPSGATRARDLSSEIIIGVRIERSPNGETYFLIRRSDKGR